MGLFDRKKEGGLMDVIRCDEQEYLVWKWRPSGEANSTKKENAIRWGSSLRVKDGEVAVFFYKQNNSEMMDFILGPHDQKIETSNFPVLTNIVGSLWGGESPFQAEIYYINLQGNNQIRFAVPYFDVVDPRFPDFAVPIAVRGSITFNITDYKQFIKLNRLIEFNLENFSRQIKDSVVKYTKNIVGNCPVENGIPVIQIERKVLEISDMVQMRLSRVFESDFGINLKRLDISAIEIDKESDNYQDLYRITKQQQIIQAEQIGRRAQIETDIYAEAGHLGVQSQHIQAHAINKQAEVLQTAAESMGQMGGMSFGGGDGLNPAGMMMGMAMGGTMANQMTGMMNGFGQVAQPQQQAPAMGGAPVPPPIPTSVQYTVAVNGQQYGPYNIQQMQQMAQGGQINASTLVWAPGMPQWAAAGSIPELASLFMATPPPVPPMPPTL